MECFVSGNGPEGGDVAFFSLSISTPSHSAMNGNLAIDVRAMSRRASSWGSLVGVASDGGGRLRHSGSDKASEVRSPRHPHPYPASQPRPKLGCSRN